MQSDPSYPKSRSAFGTFRTVTAVAHPDLEALTAQETLAYAVEHFHPSLVVACSFQKEASVIMDMLMRLEPATRFFTLDTAVLFPETVETWRKVETHYGIEIEGVRGDTSQDGLWNTDPDRCCDLRKVTPLRETLAGNDAWVSGVRRDQSAARASTRKLAWDAKHGLWKLNPLADWNEKQVWSYIVREGVPYHPLHDRGYASIGCTHCTVPSSGRGGRWAGLEKDECGIHAA
jgi:phosphoadenosine phosphosulfate reductase